MERWVGRVAVVTGASSGVGEATAAALVEHGLEVVALARREDQLLALQKRLEGKKGRLHPIKTDLTKEEEILAAFAWVGKNLGAVHVVVNNAGMTIKKNFDEYDTADWQQMFSVNLLAPSIVSREAIKSMKKFDIDLGHIINVSSVAATVSPLPRSIYYAGMKRAVNALSEGLRNEIAVFGTKIKITNLTPGLTKTEFHGGPPLPDSLPIMEAEDIASGVIYALSTPPHLVVTELTLEPLGESIYELAGGRTAQVKK